MTTQNKPQPARTINVVSLATDRHIGTLTMVVICRPSWFEELLLMSDREAINLKVSGALPQPAPTDGNILVLGMERTKADPTLSIGGEAFCILPEELWPAADAQFDDFVGSLRTCLGHQIEWEAIASTTEGDPRLNGITVDYRSSYGLSTFECVRENAPVSRKVSLPRPSI